MNNSANQSSPSSLTAATSNQAQDYAWLHNYEFPETRDPEDWPFAQDSIWNTPIGRNAKYVDAEIGPATGRGMTYDREVWLTTPDAPLTPVYKNNVGWGNGDRYKIQGPKLFDAPIPTDFLTLKDGRVPNMTVGILMPDGRTIKQNQPFVREQIGGHATSKAIYPDADIKGAGTQGAHGGSGLSSIGGGIRLGELVPQGEINHVLSVNLFADKYLAYNNDGTRGYRWPAVKADSYAADVYGGDVPDLEMGSLLALTPDFDITSLQTEPAMIVAEAFMNYGGRVVDDTAWDVYALGVHQTEDGDVPTEFKETWGYDFNVQDLNHPWAQDMRDIFTSLNVVANDSEDNIGGGGTLRAPLAPAFADDAPKPGPLPEPTPEPEPEPEPDPIPEPNDNDPTPQQAIGEYGTLDLNHQWQTVSLGDTYDNPVVIVSDPTFNGLDPANIRVRHVTGNTFQLRIQEPNYKDNWHVSESISYIVMEAGEWTLADGTQIAAGTHDSSRLTSEGFDTIGLEGFQRTPTVLSQVQTTNGGDWVTTRTTGQSANRFQLAMQEEEARNQYGHTKETLGWLAIEQGTASDGDTVLQGGTTGRGADHTGGQVQFEEAFNAAPSVIAKLGSFYGEDTASLRLDDISRTSFGVTVQEETSLDAELNHMQEAVSFLALEGTSGVLTGVEA